MLSFLIAALASAPAEPDRSESHPNVVLIMTDDQGLGDFSHAGHGVLETPHLDRLAAESPKVARFYVSPVCSPTRASLMTGRWNYRTRVVDTWIGRSLMDPSEVTLAEVLRDAGFATGIFGKWHLGDCYPLRPQDQGFETSLVHRGGGLAQPSEPIENERRYTDPILFANGVEIQTEGYCTDVYFEAALDFIDQSRAAERPFFAYIATNAPHDPYHDVPTELYEKYAGLDMEPALRGKSEKVDREARICAMIENVDQNVGRLLGYLDENELADDTLVVFLNDNGPVWGRYARDLRGYKSSVYEGGIRAPLFVRWPGRLDSKTRVDHIAAHIDLFPTLLDLAGVEPPADLRLDGRSLAPLLLGTREAWPERDLVLQSHRGNEPVREHHFALIGQRWKLVRASGFGKPAAASEHPFELFDLSVDPGEANDLSSEHPELVTELRARYSAWYDDVSTTRSDNWSPPRIVVGHAAERLTVLTKQDRRVDEGEGWDNEGWWWLETNEPVSVDVTLIFRGVPELTEATLFVGQRELRRSLTVGGSSQLAFGSLELPAGELLLRVETDGTAVHQVELLHAD